MNFYTADLHFYHTNIIKYEDRPFKDAIEMNETLIANWNKKVKRGDSIYILGDFAFTSAANVGALLDRLNGNKYLIKGNHDSFLRDGGSEIRKFIWIKDYARIKDNGYDVILFHYPIAVFDKQHHGAIHLYGHIHSNGRTRHPLTVNIENAYNVGVDVWNFEPVTLKEILNHNNLKET